MENPPVPAKPETAPVPIWRCTDAVCKAWVREELAGVSQPACPICKGPMIRSIKHLPKLVKKTPKKKKKEEPSW